MPLPVHPCTLEGFAAAYGPALPLHQRAPASGTLAAAAGGGTAATAAQLTGAGAVPASDATSSSCPFVRDGVYLLHRQGHYCPGPAPTPLALLWKDLGCSRWARSDWDAGIFAHRRGNSFYRHTGRRLCSTTMVLIALGCKLLHLCERVWQA